MYKINGKLRPFLYVFFLTSLLFVTASCQPKKLDVIIEPAGDGYTTLINQNVLLVETPDFKAPEKIPGTVILGNVNAGVLKELAGKQIREFDYPDQDKRPAYLNSAIEDFKKQKIKVHQLRQNSYVPLKQIELIVLAPFVDSVYDETSRLTFKLIFGRKSFILAPVLDGNLIETLTKSYGRDGLRTDFLVVWKVQDVSNEEIREIFGNPKIIIASEIDPHSPLHFEEIF